MNKDEALQAMKDGSPIIWRNPWYAEDNLYTRILDVTTREVTGHTVDGRRWRGYVTSVVLQDRVVKNSTLTVRAANCRVATEQDIISLGGIING